MQESTPYLVSARKYRPSTFKSVVGQKSLTSTLKNAVDSGKLAQAYLFCGPRGVGKTSCARIFAKTINCLNPTPDGEACGECESCRSIDLGNSFNLVELDAASNNSVDDIRSITEQVNIPPQNGKYRVFIIDEVHMLSNSAFNAFLKTLEEPPRNVVFILATTEKHKVIPTILSRCQIYDFKRITVDDMVDHLEFVAKSEGVEAEREALGVIAQKSDGAMRDALSIFDQVAASTFGKVTYANTIENLNVLDYDYYFRLTDFFREGNVVGSLVLLKEITDKGFDPQFLVNGLASHIRDLMVASHPDTVKLLEKSEEIGKKYLEQARNLPVEWYYAAMKLLNDCDLNYKTASSKRLLVELTFIRLSQLLNKSKNPFEDTDRLLPPDDPFGDLKAVAMPPRNSSKSLKDDAPEKEKETDSEKKKEQEKTNREEDKKVIEPTAPTTQNVKPSNSSRSSSRRPSSFRLGGLGQGNVSSAGIDLRKNTFSDSRFNEVWEDFIKNNPTLHILINAMKACKPERTEESLYRIKVGHPAQKQAFEQSMADLLGYIRNKLENDLVRIEVVVDDQSDSQKKLPPREFLKKVVEENPVLAKYLKELDTELI